MHRTHTYIDLGIRNTMTAWVHIFVYRKNEREKCAYCTFFYVLHDQAIPLFFFVLVVIHTQCFCIVSRIILPLSLTILLCVQRPENIWYFRALMFLLLRVVYYWFCSMFLKTEKILIHIPICNKYWFLLMQKGIERRVKILP